MPKPPAPAVGKAPPRVPLSRERVLDGIADLVMDEVEVPSPDLDWRTSVRRSAISAHEAFRRHPWAGLVMESRLKPRARAAAVP